MADRKAVFAEKIRKITSQVASNLSYSNKVGVERDVPPRCLVKVGTTVVTDETGKVALGRVGNVVNQICELKRSGVEVSRHVSMQRARTP